MTWRAAAIESWRDPRGGCDHQHACLRRARGSRLGLGLGAGEGSEAHAATTRRATGSSHRATMLRFASPMPQYVIEREVPGAGEMSEEEIQAISLKSLGVLEGMGPQIRWLHSYVTENKLYCVYLAPDEATVREHAARGGFPANRIAAVKRLIDPVNYQ